MRDWKAFNSYRPTAKKIFCILPACSFTEAKYVNSDTNPPIPKMNMAEVALLKV